MNAILRFGAYACLVGFSLVSRVAGAEEHDKATLSWIRMAGAESCVTGIELGVLVEKHLGRPAFVSVSQADLAIEGRIEWDKSKGRFKASIGGTRKDRTPIGRRELYSESADCRPFDASLALVVALMIDPSASLEPTATKTEVPEQPVEQAAPVTPPKEHFPPTETAPAPAKQMEPVTLGWTVDAELAVTASAERLAGFAPGITLVARAGWSPRWLIEFTAHAIPGSSTPANNGSSIQLSLIEGGIGLCPNVAARSWLELGACGGARFGSIRARPTGLIDSGPSQDPLFDLSLGPRATFLATRSFFFAAGMNLLVPVLRQRWIAQRAATASVVPLLERSAVGAEFLFGAGLRFSP